MREILFRGKNADNGKWIEGQYIRDVSREGTSLSKFAHKIQPLREQAYAHPADPETICQYTGLTDKNGEKIWENDIVVISCEEDEFFIIKWDAETARFILESETLVMDFDNYYSYEMDIVGNIFDNPDLLKK